MILFVMACFSRGRIETTFTLGFLAAYLLTRIIPALYIGAPLEDFFQAYRWILYLVAFAIAVGREWGPVRGLVNTMWVLLGLAFFKSALTFALYGPGERPGLLLENNFEIALFCGLVVVLYRFLGRWKLWAVVLMGAIAMLAGSRSGAIAFVVLALFAVSQAKRANLFLKYLMALALPVVVFAAVLVFEQRTVTGRSVDRQRFADIFFAETANWDAFTWLFGTVPITPLSGGACFQLSYYQLLFSSEGDGSCYAVILHAFLMRVVYDAGIVGLLIAFGVTWLMMRRAKVQFAIAASMLLIAITNSFSVSGLNNPYVALPILLAIMTTGAVLEEKTPRPHRARGSVRARARA
ncbi:MAG TPA: hypothetical protein VIQ11_20120 [Mycobacterium sp.]